MPFPSTGCQTCRTRRIKCDETQPVCRRCIKAHRHCDGPVDADSLSLYLENAYASKKMKRPRGPRGRAAVIESQMSIQIQISTLTPFTSLAPCISPPYSLVDLRAQALGYYLNYHLQPLDDTSTPIMSRNTSDAIRSVWASTSSSSSPILTLGISCMALTVFSRTHDYAPAAVQAGMLYHQLLQMMQLRTLAMETATEDIDVYLLAILFMSRHEDLVNQSPADSRLTFSNFLHLDGTLVMLKIWRGHVGPVRPATDVITNMRRGVVRSALLRDTALPEWIADGASFGETGLALEFDRFVVQTIQLRKRVDMLCRRSTASTSLDKSFATMLEICNQEAIDTDLALQEWPTRFPSEWGEINHHHLDSDTSAKDICPPSLSSSSRILYSYPSTAHAAVWNKYYTTRMLVNSTRLTILDLITGLSSSQSPSPILTPTTPLAPSLKSDLEGCYQQQQLECLSCLITMSTSFANSLPFCLQKFCVTETPTGPNNGITLKPDAEIQPYNASLLVWPLTVAAAVKHVDGRQKAWFKFQLARVGRVVGLGVLV